MTVFAYAYTDPYIETVDVADFGQPVDRLYVDRTTATSRLEQQQLLATVETDPPQQLVVRQISELGDSVAAVVAAIHAIEAAGVTIQTLDESYSTAATPLAIAPERLPQLAETVQKQHRRQQLQAGHARNRVNTLPPPGRAPYGYRRSRYRYALDRATAPVVKDFFENFILYGSIRGAARYLEKAYGKRISVSTAQRWLRHPAYRGDLLYQDGRVIRDTHTPIISREEAAQVDRLLRRNRKLPPKTVSAKRSLAGLVKCAECGHGLRVSRVAPSRKKQEYLYLRPIQCGRSQTCRAIAYEAVLQQAIATICEQFPQAVKNLQGPPTGAIKGQLDQAMATKQAVLAQLDDLQAAGILDESTAALRAYTLRSELAALAQQASQLPPENLSQIAQTLATEQFWQDLSEVERRVYLREFVKAILVERSDDNWRIRVRFVF